MSVAVRGSAAALGLLLIVAPAFPYVTQPPVWPRGSVVLELQLGPVSRQLLDGARSWGQSAERAAADWNQYIGSLQFKVVRDSNASVNGNNGKNNVFWSSTAYGKSFDDYASGTQNSGVIAVTLWWSVGGRRTEADVVFKNTLAWNSYDGPLRRSSSGGWLLDLHRVALHEFGHVLGLGHPNDSGQSVVAQMNSATSDYDTLSADDVAGARALYGR